MINTTQNVVFRRNPIGPGLLAAVEYCYGVAQGKLKSVGDKKHYMPHRTGIELLAPHNIMDGVGEEFIQSLCEFSVENFMTASESLRTRVDSGLKRKITIPLIAQNRMKSHGRFILYRLWVQGDILLPITFRFQSSLDKETILECAPDLLRACLTWAIPGDKQAEYRYRYHVPRWLLATTWLRPEDIDLDDALAVNRFLNDCREKKIEFLKSTINPTVRLLLDGLAKTMPGRVACTEEDLRLWDLYHIGGYDSSVRFSEIEASDAIRVAERDTKRGERAVAKAAAQRAAYGLKRATIAAESVLSADSSVWDPEHIAFGVKFKRERGDWFATTDNLSFLPVQISDEGKDFWCRLFDKFQKHRKLQKGYEADRNSAGALRVFCDYLSICLPAYYGLNEPEGAIPTSPREFTRYPYVDGAGDELNAPTLLEYIYRRLGETSQYATINQLQKFFAFIALNYGNDQSESSKKIAGKDFRNPIDISIDQRAQKGTKRRVTNKKPFSANVVPHLLSYMYAIEEFGMFLREKQVVFSGNLNSTWLNPKDYGFEPTYEHLGQAYPLEHVPFALVRPHPGQTVPSLTRLRMFLFDLETGVRMQAAQWLCKNTFDKANAGINDNRFFYWIWINTDKVNDGFPAPVLPRVRDLLYREKADQDEYGVEDEAIYYERREHTRFETLVPLFRNSNTGQPFSDGYDEHWYELMRSFHDHFNKQVGMQPLIRSHDTGTREISYGADEAAYCPIGFAAVHTPHSCRSTFVTRRSSFISLDDISTMIGHADKMLTAHYDYPEADAVGHHVAFASNFIGDATASEARSKSGPAYIKAHAANASMVKAFAADRQAAIRDFGFVALKSFLQSETSADALKIMSESPMAQIIFRPTHVCVVGEICPAEVIKIVGARRRCGACPLCVRSVDHLPAIGAYLRHKQERFNGLQRHYQRVAKDPDCGGDLAEIYDTMDEEVQEFLAWRVAEDVLGDIAAKYGKEADQHLHAFEPDFVRDHVQTVVKACSEQEFVLRRIMDSDTYPAMATERVEGQALRIKYEIMASRDLGEYAIEDEGDEITEVSSFIKTVLDSKKLTIEQVATRLSAGLTYRGREVRLIAGETH